jgi:hypothetical protein
MLGLLDDFIPEKVSGLLSPQELAQLCQTHLTKDIRLQDAEKYFSQKVNEAPLLINQDEFVPLRFAVAIV